MSSNMSLQPKDRCTSQGWGQRKLKSVAISAGTMPRNKPHSCFRIALSRQLSRGRSPRLNNSMWLKEGREAINVAVPAGFFLKRMWRGSVSHKSQLEQLLVSKLRQRERSTTAWQQWHLPGRSLVVSSDQKELNERPLNDSCPDEVSLGRREKMIHTCLSCAMPFIAVLSPCAGSASSQIPCWAAYTWRVLKVMTFYPPFFFSTSIFAWFFPLSIFVMQSSLFLPLSHFFLPFRGCTYLSLYSNISVGNTGNVWIWKT